MKVLVTGGSGMVGQSLKQLKPEWTYLSSNDVDLRNYTTTFNTIINHNPQVVIHLAANVGGLFKNLNHQSEMLYDNLSMNMNVVKVCGLMNIRLITCLSTCIFPDKVEYPITKDKLHDGPPHQSNFGYAYAKRMMDVMCESFPNLNYTCIIPCNIYGPYDNFNIKHGHVIPSLIHKAYLAKQQGLTLQVCGTGKPLRQFIYSGDMAKIIIQLLSGEDNTVNTQHRSRIIFAPKDEYSIHYIVQFIANVYQVEYEFDNDVNKDGQFKKTCLSEYTFQFTSLKDGLNKTIDWFNANYKNARK